MAVDASEQRESLTSPRKRLEESCKQARLARDQLRDDGTTKDKHVAEHADLAVIALEDALTECGDSNEGDGDPQPRVVADGGHVTTAMLDTIRDSGGEASAGMILNSAVRRESVDVHQATAALQTLLEAGDVYMPEPDQPLLKLTTAQADVLPDGGDSDASQ